MRLTMLLALTEELRPFGADDVAKLRAEFLMIMKNVERVATYEAAVQLQDAMTTWRQHFTHTIDDIIAGIPEVTKGVGHDGYWKKEIGTGTWDMHIYFKLPLDTTDSEAHRWRGTTMRSATPEELFARFARERTKWAAKIKDAARKAWTVLKKYLEWAADHAKGPVVKNSPPIEMATLAGFKVKLVGEQRTNIEMVKAALARYRARGMKVFPWLIQHQLPLVFEFDSSENWGGRYKGTFIKIAPGWYSNDDDLPRTLAHEMGHHAWAVYLSSADRDFWRAAIAHNRMPLDLKHLISIWPAGKHNHSLFDLEDYLKVHDPVMFLQVQALISGYGLHASADFTSYEGVQDMIARGIKSVPVPSNPITAYAEKNPEEAFCEALGTLVAYGPRALMPAVRSWLAMILPAVRMEGKVLRRAPVLG